MTQALPIVDMRIRPTFLHDFFGATPGTPEYETVRWLNRRVGSHDVDHFTRSPTLPAFLAEMETAGLTVGVMVGRSTPTVRIANETLSDITHRSGGRLIAFGSVDPIDLGPEAAMAELRRAVGELGLSGINIDAGFYATPLKANADLLLPLYEACEQLGAPVCIMSGPTTPDLEFNDPFAVDRVARLFPKLTIICCHGFYPRIADMVTVALRHENIFVSPDMYLFSPGGRLYVEAANGFMQDQLLFGTSYPFRPMSQSVDDLFAIGLTQTALEKVCYANACRALKLNLPSRQEFQRAV